MTNYQKYIKKEILKNTQQLVEDMEFYPLNIKVIETMLNLMKVLAKKTNDNRLIKFVENAIDTNGGDQTNLISKLRNIQFIIQQEIKLEEECLSDEELQEIEEIEKTELNDFENSRGIETSYAIKY